MYYVSFPGGTGAMMQTTQTSAPTPMPPGRPSPSNFYLTDWQAWNIRALCNNLEGLACNDPVVVAGQTTGRGCDSNFEPRADYDKFIITTTDGTRYVFAHPTLSTYRGIPDGPPTEPLTEYYVGTWRLVSILGHDYQANGPDLPTGNEAGSWIRFHYRDVVEKNEQIYTFSCLQRVQAAYLEKIVTPTHEAHFTIAGREKENWSDWEHTASIVNSRLSNSMTGMPQIQRSKKHI